MNVASEKRKLLIDFFTTAYRDSFNREFVWGKPDKNYLDSLAESFAICLVQAREWIGLAEEMGWKAIAASAKKLNSLIEDSLKFADKGGDPFIHGMQIVQLLELIPGDIAKQKLGISSWKEMRRLEKVN